MTLVLKRFTRVVPIAEVWYVLVPDDMAPADVEARIADADLEPHEGQDVAEPCLELVPVDNAPYPVRPYDLTFE